MNHSSNIAISGGLNATTASTTQGVVNSLSNASRTASLTGMGQSNMTSQPRLTPWTINTKFPIHVFKHGRPLWPGIAADNSEYAHFYLSLWAVCEQPDPETYGILITTERVDPITFGTLPGIITLLFSDENAYAKFNIWHESFKARFGALSWAQSYFPSLTSGSRVDGYAYPAFRDENAYSFNTYDGIHANWFDEWAWIVKNTYDPVLHVNGFWIFQNESEMIMFKMRDKK